MHHHINFLVLQSIDDDVEIGDREGCTRDLETVGAQVGDLCPKWRFAPLHDGHDGDQRGHTDRQAQLGSQVTGAPQTRRLIGNRPAIQPAKITS